MSVSEVNEFTFPVRKPAKLIVTAAARKRDRLIKVRPRIFRNVRIAAKRDWNIQLARQPEKFFGRINLPTRFTQTGRTDLNGATGSLDSPESRPVIKTWRPKAKFFRQIRMRERIKKPGTGSLFPQVEVLLPTLSDILVFPVGRTAIHGKVADEVDAPEKKVPRMAGGELANPAFPAREEIHFQSKFNG